MAGKTVTIELDEDLARALKERADAHGYASEADVIRDGLLALDDAPPELTAEQETRLKREIRERIAEYERDPSSAIPAHEMRARMDAYMRARGAKGE